MCYSLGIPCRELKKAMARKELLAKLNAKQPKVNTDPKSNAARTIVRKGK